MKNFFYAVLVMFIFLGCLVNKAISAEWVNQDFPVASIPPIFNSDINSPLPVEFISVDPRTSPWFEKETSKGKKKLFWEDLTNAQANLNLPIERSFVSILREDVEAGVGFVSAKFTDSAGKYKIILDYAKYRDELMGEKKIPCLVGVGVRIIANVTTNKANLDLGSLFAISFAAKSGYLKGQIEVVKIGIDLPRQSMLLPPPTEINDTSLQNALQAVAAIRAKLYDSDTKLLPHVLAIQYQVAVKK